MCPLDSLFILLECHWIRSPYPLYSPGFFYDDILVRYEELLTDPKPLGTH